MCIHHNVSHKRLFKNVVELLHRGGRKLVKVRADVDLVLERGQLWHGRSGVAEQGARFTGLLWLQNQVRYKCLVTAARLAVSRLLGFSAKCLYMRTFDLF
jgi:hypothetical protein